MRRTSLLRSRRGSHGRSIDKSTLPNPASEAIAFKQQPQQSEANQLIEGLQEPSKRGDLSEGVSAESSVTNRKTINSQGYWAQQYTWHAERHSQERRTFLQRLPFLKPPSSWFPESASLCRATVAIQRHFRGAGPQVCAKLDTPIWMDGGHVSALPPCRLDTFSLQAWICWGFCSGFFRGFSVVP